MSDEPFTPEELERFRKRLEARASRQAAMSDIDEAMRRAAEVLRDKKALQDELSAADLSVTRADVQVAQVIRSLAASGFVLVPREATREIWIAAGDIGDGFGLTANQVMAVWRAMLAAAPKPGGGA